METSGKKWLNLLLFLPLVFIFVFTNIYEDPGNILHNDSKAIAEALLSGHEAYIGSGNGDERSITQYVVKGMPKHIDVITVGPSLSFGIRREHVGTDRYFNLSVSGSNFYDIMADFGLLKLNDVAFKRVIFCVDSYFFDESKYENGSRNPDMMPYAEYMIDVLDGINPKEPDNPGFEEWYLKFSQAFSVSYFQASKEFIQSNRSYLLPEKRWGIMDETTENLAHYLPDVSLVYKLEYRNNTVENVLNEAEKYPIESQFSKGNHVSEYSKEMFLKLISYLQERSVEIEFYLCPLAPALWDRLQEDQDTDQYYLLREIEDFANQTAVHYGIKLTGTYNPYNLNITNEDFWDARHVRHEKLSIYFDFMPRQNLI